MTIDIMICRTTEFLKGLTHCEDLSAKTDLVASGVLNSLTLMDLLTFLEKEFQLRVGADELTPENLASVETIVRRFANRPAA